MNVNDVATKCHSIYTCPLLVCDDTSTDTVSDDQQLPY